MEVYLDDVWYELEAFIIDKDIAGKVGGDDMGYKNIIEFGGIMDWTGEIEK